MWRGSRRKSGDLCGIVKWSAGGFCAQMRIQTVPYLTADGRGSEAEGKGDFGESAAFIIELFNKKSVVPVDTAVFLHGNSPFESVDSILPKMEQTPGHFCLGVRFCHHTTVFRIAQVPTVRCGGVAL